MGLTSFQVCMDSADWFQGTIQEETGMDSSSPSGITDSMLACSRPLMERRLRPQHDQALKCPRCDSTHTKFCYYNNYSLTQPRYFCKTCRRYWTKGGTLRNIPVGGGCRKNKKISSNSKKSNSGATGNNTNDNSHHHQQNVNVNVNVNPHLINPNHHHNQHQPLIMNSNDLQLSYPESSMPFPGSNMYGIGIGSSNNIPGFMFENLNGSTATRAIDFMENGGGNLMGMMGGNDHGGYTAEMGGGNVVTTANYHGGGGNLCSPFGGMTLDSINSSFMDHQRGLMIANYDQENDDIISGIDVKPKLLALEWQDQTGCNSSDHHHHHHHGGGSASSGGGANGGGGYLTGLGSSWGGLMNGYGASTTNPLV